MENKKCQHQLDRTEGFLTLRLDGYLSIDSLKTFEADIAKINEEPYSHLLVNADHLSGMDNYWVRSLLQVARELKKVKKEIRFVLLSKELKEFFKNEGLSEVFKSSLNLKDAMSELQAGSKKVLNTEFVNPFLSATMQVLKIQAQTEVKPGKIFVRKDKTIFAGNVSGVIGLVSESFNGSVVISFPENTFLKVMSRMMGELNESLTKEIVDGAGELTNMIFGMAKVVLNEKGYGIKTAIPVVISGLDKTELFLYHGPILVVPFETDIGPFAVEICLAA